MIYFENEGNVFMLPIIYMVIPCYYEEDVLGETAKRLKEKYLYLTNNGKISEKSRILFVNDGSKDKTWDIIKNLNSADKMFTGISLSRNFGHQNAVLAGLMSCKDICDAAISMDADLQDDINAIDKMVDEFISGSQIVYGVRSSRTTDTWFKRNTARFFYKFMKTLGADIVYDHADFRLMSRRVLEELSGFREYNMFLRGIMPMIGFKTSTVTYERRERFAGKSKYSLKKMLLFALNGITSLSIKPLRFIASFGFTLFLLSLFVLFYVLWGKFISKSELEIGWASIVCSIWMIGGLQIMFIGVIGEYIGKIYSEVKDRPKYIIEENLN